MPYTQFKTKKCKNYNYIATTYFNYTGINLTLSLYIPGSNLDEYIMLCLPSNRNRLTEESPKCF